MSSFIKDFGRKSADWNSFPAAANESLIKARVSLEIRDSPAFVAKGSKDESSFIKRTIVLWG